LKELCFWTLSIVCNPTEIIKDRVVPVSKHHAMQNIGGGEVELHVLLTSTVRAEWSASGSRRFTPSERPQIYWKKDRFVPVSKHHAMRTYKKWWGRAPLIINLDSRKWVISFRLPSL